ncbi:MAG: 4-alpha-glucanotransferase, partial [Muribaculaceae bacterium]|nr:4-alpha-glucanotransferase [Muribaculaceae bacterium]
MKLIFAIDYHTVWGESLYITGPLPELGNSDDTKALKMELHGAQTWIATIDVKDDTPAFGYRYLVKNDIDHSIRHEYGEDHMFRPAHVSGEYRIYDSWQDQPADKPFYSSAFTDCFCRRTHSDHPLHIRKGYINLRVLAPMVLPDQVLAISGEPDQLGNWDTTRAIIMNDAHYPQWEANIELKNLPAHFQYKFLILDKTTGNVVNWEARDNRTFGYKHPEGTETMVVSGLHFVNTQPYWHGAGTAIPVFSIRTEQDFGVGDFYDIKLMVDWAAATKQSVLQLLPINDTTMTHTWTDSYPYNANSTFALHPMYLRITELGQLDNAEQQAKFDKMGAELNQLPTVDYERVNNAKTEFTRAIFAQEGDKTLKSKEFKEFLNINSHWLTPYATFCVLRDKYRTPNFNAWDEYAVYDSARIDKFIEQNPTDINYVYYIQYHLDKQMREVRRYANEHGVALKGDIPIGISRYSVDAWIEPRLFNLDCQAGAPPDDFSILGQNWGFPTYNWEEMSKDGFQ